jgi:hypothetical protein
MRNLEVVAINAYRHTGSGTFAVAVSRYPMAYGYSQLYAPVFKDAQTAEVFSEVAEITPIDDGPEAELALARRIEKFIQDWDEAHGDDDTYPTSDGRYPNAKLMAQWFLQAPPAEGASALAAAKTKGPHGFSEEKG